MGRANELSRRPGLHELALAYREFAWAHPRAFELHLGAKTHERMTFAGIRVINVAEIVEFEPGRKTAF